MAQVLLVDDDPDIRDAIGACLRDEAHEVITAEHGRAALTVLESGFVPAVILLDLMMPVMNGFEVLQALRAAPEWEKIPVLVVSANQGYEADDFGGRVLRILRKPVEIEDLCEAIKVAAAA